MQQSTYPVGQTLNTNQPIQQTNTQPTYQSQENISTTYKGSMQDLSLFQKFWMILSTSIAIILIITILPRMLFRPSTIQVIGEGKLNFEAEQVKMVVTRLNTGSSSTATINEGDIGVNQLIESAKTVAGPSVVIKKAFYQVQPVANQNTSQYQVANAFSIEFKDVTKTNAMIKTLYNEGATTVSNVTFESNDIELTSQEARNLAVENAKEEAKSIAKAAGKRVGKLVSITDDNQEVSSNISNVAAEDNGANFSNVSITKKVSVIYEIW